MSDTQERPVSWAEKMALPLLVLWDCIEAEDDKMVKADLCAARRIVDDARAALQASEERLSSQAPLQVSDEMVRAAKRILFHDSEDCDDEVRAAIEAALATPRGET